MLIFNKYVHGLSLVYVELLKSTLKTGNCIIQRISPNLMCHFNGLMVFQEHPIIKTIVRLISNRFRGWNNDKNQKDEQEDFHPTKHVSYSHI